MKKLFLFALAVTALFSSCEKNPDLNKLGQRLCCLYEL